MEEIELDLKGLKCPQPILKIQSKAATVHPGTVIRVEADCSSFERDLNIWASKTGKTILECMKVDRVWNARIKV